jgi:hypothetical protein
MCDVCPGHAARRIFLQRKESKMRRMNRILMLFSLLGAALLWAAPPGAAGQRGAAGKGAPTPDGRFQVMTTSISPGMGISWADGRFSFKNQDYKFRLEAQTITESDVLNSLAGQQIAIEGLVYNLKDVSDFAGTYTRVKPEVVKAMGGSSRDPVFQNNKGVVVRVTRRIKMDDSLFVSLLGDSFTVTLRDF